MQTMRKVGYSLWMMLLLAGLLPATAVQAECRSERVRLQMLGTRGPELWDGQASTSYLLWLDGKAKVVVDAGPGNVQNFEKSGARYEDLALFLFTHFHIDHSADFPAYVKGGFFTERDRDLLLIGPDGNDYLPSARDFLFRLFGLKTGLYPYLNSFIDGSGRYRIVPKTVPSSYRLLDERQVYGSEGIKVTAVSVHHGVLPALAYRLEIAGCVISFTGDMSGRFHTMPDLAKGSDILVAHNAIPENETGVGQLLHMKPSYIGELAAQAGVKQLLLTHLMRRSVSHQEETVRIIRKLYQGPILFPRDLDSFTP